MERGAHRLINFIDTKAKCVDLKKFTCKGIVWQVFICLRPPIPPFTLCICVNCILIHRERGGGGRDEPKRR
jgi:hypothetical protein